MKSALRARGTYALVTCLLPLVFAGCATVEKTHQEDSGRVVDAVIRWQDEALALVQKYQLNPLRAARALAAMHGAIHDTDTAMRDIGTGCREQNIESVSARTLEYFFPLEAPGRLRAKAELAQVGRPRCPMQAADTAVQRVIARAQIDGAFPPRRIRTNPHPFVGDWKPTAPIFMNTPAEPFAGDWKLYFADHASSFTLPKPLDPSSAPYREATQQVINIKAILTAEQMKAADFWHLDAGSVTPPGVWNQELRRMLKQSTAKIDTIRLLAAANQAMYDALVVCWHYKYTYWTERPITAADRLGLGSFTPRLVTPPFPSYPSGHSTVSGAVATVIASYLPDQAAEAHRLAQQAADSRLWGGIHFDFDNGAGLDLGVQVGQAALKGLSPASMPNR